MTLRERCVEAGAKALDDELGNELRAHLGHVLRKWPNTISETAEVMFDAILAVLREHADEWIDEEWDMQVASWSGATRDDVKRSTNKYLVKRLLAVLEGSDE